MKLDGSLLLLLVVALLFGAYLNRSCFGPPSQFDVAVDTFKVRDAQAAKDSVRWSAVVDSVAEVAGRSAQDADSLRIEARRLAAMSASLKRANAARRAEQTPPEGATGDRDTVPTSPGDLVQSQPYDSLLAAYDLMVRVDSLNQVTIGALTRRIAADSEYIASLERVREAGQRVVATKPGRKLLGCRIGATALIDLQGRVHAGGGVTCGL